MEHLRAASRQLFLRPVRGFEQFPDRPPPSWRPQPTTPADVAAGRAWMKRTPSKEA